MKKLFTLIVTTTLLLGTTGCKYDDTQVWDTINSIEDRVSAMETVMNAYKNNLLITSVTSTADGYVIAFSDGSKATIANGQDGKDGENGKDGEDGKDGDTYIQSITVGEDDVTFLLTDGQQFSIALYSLLTLTFEAEDLVVMSANASRDIRYTVKSYLTEVELEAISSADIKAKVVPDDASNLTGVIHIESGATMDEYSKVVVLASNGERVVMKSFAFEETGVQVTDNTTKNIGSLGGEVTLEFLSNIACSVIIPAEAQSWISIVPSTRALTPRTITLKLARNNGYNRSAEITVQAVDGSVSVTYTIKQTGALGDNNYYVSTDYSEDGKVTALQTATVGNGIDIVLMGDGYSDRQIAAGTYDNTMQLAAEKLFSEEPYKSFREYFNVYAVTAVSATEGYEHGDTAFEGYFGDGTFVGGNDQVVFAYAQKAIASGRMNDALIVVMMNSTAYAGTCWMYYPSKGDYGSGVSVAYFPVGSDETALEQVLHHEANGHGFSKLADEYSYQYMGKIPQSEINNNKYLEPYGWWKNVDYTDDLTTIKWSKFIADERYAYDGLGAFEGGLTYWRGVWRPTENSIMRYNYGGFNAPSREAIYYRIHKLAFGDSWEYDYEAFVEYDAINRKTSASSGAFRFNVPQNFEPLHPPVVKRMSWRDAN